MLTQILVALGGIAALGLVVWLAWRFGKSAGGSEQRAADLEVAAEIRDREQEAAAAAPRDKDGVLDRLRRYKLASPLALGLAAAIGLSACAPKIVTACPPLVQYPAEFQDRLLAEIEPLPNDDPIIVVLRDYIALRDQVKACRGS